MKYHYVNQKKIHKQELIDLTKSTIAIALAFTILYFKPSLNMISLAILFGVSILTAGAGFLLHELAHKYFALRFGAKAFYVSNDKMLIFAIVTAIIGFIFAAPGAVNIRGNLSPKQLGLTSLSGPIVNFLLVGVFLVLSLLFPIFYIGVVINVVLFAFNMIPIPPFDGYKVYKWNKPIYFLFAGIALALYVWVFFLQNL